MRHLSRLFYTSQHYFSVIFREKYANFKGRARREEYAFHFINIIILLLIGSFLAIVTTIGIGFIFWYFFNPNFIFTALLATLLIPTIAVGTRRLHDTGRSGWWQLLALTGIGIIPLLIWLCTKGDKGENKYGEDPKTTTDFDFEF